MTWMCKDPNCDRLTKGFPNGKTLCGVCQSIETKKLKKVKIK